MFNSYHINRNENIILSWNLSNWWCFLASHCRAWKVFHDSSWVSSQNHSLILVSHTNQAVLALTTAGLFPSPLSPRSGILMEQKEIMNWTVWYKQAKQMPLQRFERDIASPSSAERAQLQKQIKGFGGRFKGKRRFSPFNFYLLIFSSSFILQSLFSPY